MLHLGGVGTAGVESLSFALPEEWDGMAVTLHIEQDGGTLPQPVLLDESREVTIDHRFTAARQGLWMLLAQSADGYTAMSCRRNTTATRPLGCRVRWRTSTPAYTPSLWRWCSRP